MTNRIVSLTGDQLIELLRDAREHENGYIYDKFGIKSVVIKKTDPATFTHWTTLGFEIVDEKKYAMFLLTY